MISGASPGRGAAPQLSFPTMNRGIFKGILMASAAALLLGVSACAPQGEEENAALQVVASIPDIGSIVREVGGEEVSVVSLVPGSADPHFHDPSPSQVAAVAKAELLVINGMSLEGEWLGALLTAAGANALITDGGLLSLDTVVLEPIEDEHAEEEDHEGEGDHQEGETAAEEMAAKNVHAEGNPHYLLDPWEGARAIELVAARLSEARPEASVTFEGNAKRLIAELSTYLVGESLETAAELDAAIGSATQGVMPQLLSGVRNVIVDHDLWVYVTRRLGWHTVGSVETAPGIAPTAKHLAGLLSDAQEQGVDAVLASSQIDRETVESVARQVGAPLKVLAHQTEDRPQCDSYLATVRWNFDLLVEVAQGSTVSTEE